MEQGICQHCGGSLTRPALGRPQSKFCSRTCKEAARSADLAAAVMQRRVGRVCEECGAAISADRNNRARTCSRECGVRLQNRLRAERRRAEWDANRPVCEFCGETIPDDRRAGSKFCSARCKGNAHSVLWRRKAPGYMRHRNYGLTEDAFAALLEKQGGKCAICGTSDWSGKHGTPNVDHDHATGRVRGILYSHCNHGIGQLRDDPDLLRAAIRYLS